MPWLNDEDGSRYTFMNRGAGGLALPNFTNSVPFEIATWGDEEFVSVVLDEELFEDLLDNPDNRGLRLAARQSGSNWRVTMREQSGGSLAAFLEVTVTRDVEPPGADLKPGDANHDGGFNISDPVAHLNFLFASIPLPACYVVPNSDPVMLTVAGLAVLDFDGDGSSNITDAIGALNFLFAGAAGHVSGNDCAKIPGTCEPKCLR